MAVTELTIVLPVNLGRAIEASVASGEYVDASEYVRELIRADQRALTDLRAAIDAGLASGNSEQTVDQIFDEVMARRRDDAAAEDRGDVR